MNSLNLGRKSKFPILCFLLIFKVPLLYSQSEPNLIREAIISKIKEKNGKVRSYKVQYNIQEEAKSGDVIRKGEGTILFDRDLRKIKNIFIRIGTKEKFVSLYDRKENKYISYIPENKICNIVDLLKLEKTLGYKIKSAYFITTIQEPFSKLEIKKTKYISVENIGLTWAYHFKYKNMDFWIGTEDGLLYKKKIINNGREITFYIKKIEKNININPENFLINFPSEVKKIDLTEKWIKFFRKE